MGHEAIEPNACIYGGLPRSIDGAVQSQRDIIKSGRLLVKDYGHEDSTYVQVNAVLSRFRFELLHQDRPIIVFHHGQDPITLVFLEPSSESICTKQSLSAQFRFALTPMAGKQLVIACESLKEKIEWMVAIGMWIQSSKVSKDKASNSSRPEQIRAQLADLLLQHQYTIIKKGAVYVRDGLQWSMRQAELSLMCVMLHSVDAMKSPSVWFFSDELQFRPHCFKTRISAGSVVYAVAMTINGQHQFLAWTSANDRTQWLMAIQITMLSMQVLDTFQRSTIY